MFVTKDKKTAINDEMVQSASVTAADSVSVSMGASAFTFEGDDAKAAAAEFGLTLHADDEAAEAKKAEHKDHPAAAQQSAKK